MGIWSHHQCKPSFIFAVLFLTVISTSIRPSDCVRKNSKSRDVNQIQDNINSTFSDAQSVGTRRSSKFSANLHSPLLPLPPQEMIAQPAGSSKTRRRSRDRIVVNNNNSTGKSSSGKSGQAKVIHLFCVFTNIICTRNICHYPCYAVLPTTCEINTLSVHKNGS